MRAIFKLLMAGLMTATMPQLVTAQSRGPLEGPYGGSGKRNPEWAGDGGAGDDHPDRGIPTDPGANGGPEGASGPPGPNAGEDSAVPTELEVVAERKIEETFFQDHNALSQDPAFDLPTDLYLDPLNSLHETPSFSLDELDLAAFDFPVTVNQEVKRWVEFFLTRGRGFYTGWLARSNRYLPLLEETLVAEGLPRDLTYLAMIESGFSPRATSSMSAAGLWQLMLPTGRAYGLRVDRWVDERRDPERATVAAVRHLKDLHDRFGDWYLALAAYNAGPSRVVRAMDRTGSRDFWVLARSRHLRPETRNYIPRLLAALIIARNPERFGLQDICYDDVMTFDTVTVRESTPLGLIAARLGLDEEVLAHLNPALRGRRTPPRPYQVKLPEGTLALYEARFQEVPEDDQLVYRHHRVQSGQTLSSIARYYGVTIGELRRKNQLKTSALRVGKTLLVPQREGVETTVAHGEVDELEATRRALANGVDEAPALIASAGDVGRGPIGPASERAVRSRPVATTRAASYHVREGDNMWSIARRYTVTVEELLTFNRMSAQTTLQVGQRIAIPSR